MYHPFTDTSLTHSSIEMPGRGRGRGRGRGASRGGRGRGRGRGRKITRAWESISATGNSDELDKQTSETEAMDINRDACQFFTGKATFEQHYDAQQENKERYAAALTVMHRNGVEISQSKCVCVCVHLIPEQMLFQYSRGSQMLFSTICNADRLHTHFYRFPCTSLGSCLVAQGS